MAKAKYKTSKHLSTYLAAGVIGLAGATLLGTQQAKAAQTAKVTYQNGATTVWNQPATGQQPTRYLTKGQTVKVQATKQVYGEEWYQIANDEWVPAKYFQAANAAASKTAPAKTADTVTGNYKAGAITVWTSPTSGVATGHYMVYGQTKSITNKKQVGNITWYQIGDNAWVPSAYVAYNDPQLTQTAPASATSLNIGSVATSTAPASAAQTTQTTNAASATQTQAEAGQQKVAQSTVQASQAAAQSAATQSANAASVAQAKAQQQKAAQSTAQASQAAAQSAATQSANAASAAQAKAAQEKAAQSTAQASQAAAQSAATQSANAASASQAKQQQASQASTQATAAQTQQTSTQQSSSVQTQATTNNNNATQKSNNTNYGTGAQAAISAAQSQIGVAYSWGGETPGVGFDCSGLTQWALAKAGVSIPRVTTAQESAGQRVSISQLQPGDLVFWGSAGSTYHVALYIGNNQYIHAPQPGQSVTIASISNYFKPSFGVRVF